jgi:hypothetical protein
MGDSKSPLAEHAGGLAEYRDCYLEKLMIYCLRKLASHAGQLIVD